MDLLRTLRLNGTTLRIWDTFNRDSFGKSILRYEFKVGRNVLFTGSDFHCAPSVSIDSLECAYSLLSFITLRPGDTDKEYFEEYTEEQLEWANSSKCEYLSFLVHEWEERNGIR